MNNQPIYGFKELVADCKENPILLEVLMATAKPPQENTQPKAEGDYLDWLKSLGSDEFEFVGLCIEARHQKQGGRQYA
jgi:hypothetical protein